MSERRSKQSLIKMLLNNKEEKELQEEEIIHLLLESRLSKNTSEIPESQLSFGDRMADKIAKFAGSWKFILIFVTCLIGWIVINLIMLTSSFDPYPFILLNLMLSCVAAIQAPVIMMSQNRQEEKDRLRALNNYKTSLKSEIIIEDLHQKIEKLLTRQDQLMKRLEQMAAQPQQASKEQTAAQPQQASKEQTAAKPRQAPKDKPAQKPEQPGAQQKEP